MTEMIQGEVCSQCCKYRGELCGTNICCIGNGRGTSWQTIYEIDRDKKKQKIYYVKGHEGTVKADIQKRGEEFKGFLDIVFGGLVILVMVFLRPLPKDEQGFDRDTTATLRGLAMLGIVMHHVHNRFGLDSPILSQVGYLMTGLFFFISGYGNMLSLKNRKEVNVTWLYKKVMKIYLPFLVVYVIYYIVLMCLYRDIVPNGIETFVDIVTVTLPNEVSWFPKIILLCFLNHWLARKLCSNALVQNILLVSLILLYMAIMWKTGHSGYWYNSVFCYSVGSIVARPILFGRILEWLKEKTCFSFIVFVIAFLGIFVLASRIWLLKFVCVVFFSLACYFLACVFKTRMKVFMWVGNNSFEFYVFHLVCLQLFCNLIDKNKYMYTSIVVAGSFVIVYVYLFVKRKVSLFGEHVNRVL